jgi:hypothetical protein
MVRAGSVTLVRAGTVGVLLLGAASRGIAQQVTENCTVSVLNRTVTANPDGTWILPNVPANFGPVRARVTCIVNGQTISGESDPFTVPANGVVNIPAIHFGETTPIPTSLTIAGPAGPLTQLGATTQLAVTAHYPGGSTKDVSAASAGTTFTISNAAIATITGDGLVRAVRSGTVIIQATNEGASGMLAVMVALTTSDTDGDGIPDDVELSLGLNPNNPVDAMEDFDRDGLTNLQESQRGTDPRKADTDGDGLKDGDEVARGTNPLLRDTDGDGISDGLEVQSGSDPRNPNSYNLAGALSGITVTPPFFTLTFNTIAGDVSLQLKVTGTLRDNTTIDLTSRQRGTTYASSDLTTCNFGAADGRIFAGLTGSCVITVTAGGFTKTANGTVHTFSPTPLSSLALGAQGNGVDVSGNFAYIAVNEVGLTVVDVTNRSAPHLVATLRLPGGANDVKLSGTRAYVTAGAAGLHIVDVSNPILPHLLGSVDTPGSAARVRLRGNLAFVADGAAGLQIIDVATASAPRIVGAAAIPATANGVDVTDSLAIVAAGSAGIRIVDVTNPARPVVVGAADTPGDALGVVVNGTFAYIADYTGSLRVVDFTTPSAPILGATTPGSLGGYLLNVAMADTFVFGADILFVNGVPIVDVSNPRNLIPRAILNFPGDSTGLGIAVDGSYVYLVGTDGFLYIGQYRIQEDLNGVAPTLTIAAPASGATFVEGETIPVSVVATDDLAVVGVALTADGNEVGTDTTAPYQFNVVARSGVGSLTLGASATDLANNTGVAASVQVNVIPDPLTTVVGRVIAAAGSPVSDATVNCAGRGGLSLADGSFAIADVQTTRPPVICTAQFVQADGSPLRGTSANIPPNRGGITQVGDVVIVPAPVITSLYKSFVLSNTANADLVVTGWNLTGSTFSFGTSTITITSATISPSAKSAHLTLSIGGEAGLFFLTATNSFGSSLTDASLSNGFTVIDPNSTADSDSDGIPDAVEVALGSDPVDRNSTPDPNAPRSGEINGIFSVLNGAGSTPGSPTSAEIDAPVFSVLNSGISGQPTVTEVDATVFSALNVASFTGGQPLNMQANALAFSVINGARGTAGQSPAMNAHAVSFSVMNAAITVTQQPVAMQASAVPFSVVNTAVITTAAGTAAEADATPFSTLNVAAMTGGQPTTVHAAATFSVVNEALPGSDVSGGGGLGGTPMPMEADAVVFSVNNIAPGAPLGAQELELQADASAVGHQQPSQPPILMGRPLTERYAINFGLALAHSASHDEFFEEIRRER